MKGDDIVKGGYKIINFKGVNITTDNSTTTTIKGVYEALEENYGKPILISGLKNDTVEINEFYSKFDVSGDDFVSVIGANPIDETSTEYKILTVDDEDGVTITTATIYSAEAPTT